MAGQEPQQKTGQYSMDDIVQGNQPTGSYSLADIAQAGGSPAPSTPSNRPGFLQRLGQAVGAPTSTEELKAMQPTTAEKIGGPPVMAGKMALQYGKNLYNTGKQAFQETKEATQNVMAGQPFLPNLGKSAAGAENFLLRGVLGPVGGNAVQNFGEDMAPDATGNLNTTGAMGDALGTVINALLLKKTVGPSTATRAKSLGFASGSDPLLYENTIKDIQAASGGKALQTVGDLLESVNEAKRRMNNESGLAMQPIAHQKTVPIAIADRIKSRITPEMEVSEDGPAIKQALLDKAKPFETQEWTYQQLDGLRSRLQQELTAYYRARKTGQYAAIKTDPDIMAKTEIVNGIQDAVYPQMDAVAGKPKGYFNDLKSRQGNLIRIEGDLNEQIPSLRTKTAGIQGDPSLMKNASMYMSGTGKPGFSLHKIQEIVHPPDLTQTANKAVFKGTAGPTDVRAGSIASAPGRYARPVVDTAILSLPIRSLLMNQDQQPEEAPNPKYLKQRLQDIAGQ